MPLVSTHVELPNLNPVFEALRALRAKSSAHVERFLLWMVRDMTPCRESIDLLELRARVDAGSADQGDLDDRARRAELRVRRPVLNEVPTPSTLTRMAATQLSARAGELLGAAELCVGLYARHALAQAAWLGRPETEQEEFVRRSVEKMLECLAAIAAGQEPSNPEYQRDYDEIFDHSAPEVLAPLRRRGIADASPMLELILELGSEGGCWSLYRHYDSAGKPHYSQGLNQGALAALEPGVAPGMSFGRDVDLRTAFLDLLKENSPTYFSPIRVHPDVIPLLEAIRAFERQLGPEPNHVNRRWRDVFERRLPVGRRTLVEPQAAEGLPRGATGPRSTEPSATVENENLPFPRNGP